MDDNNSTIACNMCHDRAREACYKHYEDHIGDGNYQAACEVIDLMRALGLI